MHFDIEETEIVHGVEADLGEIVIVVEVGVGVEVKNVVDLLMTLEGTKTEFHLNSSHSLKKKRLGKKGKLMT
jgi:hypothetical protein